MLDSGVAYECPTTWHAGLFSVDDLPALADTLVDAGVAHWALTAGQVERLRALFAGFVVLWPASKRRWEASASDC